jgi:hypothetical protein
MVVILGLASLMSHILVVSAKERSKKEIDSIISSYFAVKISQVRNKKIGIVEKHHLRIPTLNSLEKVNTGLS